MAQAPELARRLGMELAEGPLLIEGDGHYGNALLSRWPLRVERRERLPQWTGEPRGFIHAAVVDPTGLEWHLLVSHLSLGPLSRRRQLAVLARELAMITEPAVLLADLNEWLGARRLAVLGRVATLLPSPPTFPSGRPFLRLDRMALRGCRAVEPPVVHLTPTSRVASDHLPLKARLGRAAAQPGVSTPVAVVESAS